MTEENVAYERVGVPFWDRTNKLSELKNVYYRITREIERIRNYAHSRLRGLMNSTHVIPTEYSLMLVIEIYYPEHAGAPSSYKDVLDAINEAKKKDNRYKYDQDIGDVG